MVIQWWDSWNQYVFLVQTNMTNMSSNVLVFSQIGLYNFIYFSCVSVHELPSIRWAGAELRSPFDALPYSAPVTSNVIWVAVTYGCITFRWGQYPRKVIVECKPQIVIQPWVSDHWWVHFIYRWIINENCMWCLIIAVNHSWGYPLHSTMNSWCHDVMDQVLLINHSDTSTPLVTPNQFTPG